MRARQTDLTVTDPINPGFRDVVLAAVKAVKQFVLAPDQDLGYVSKREIPKFKVNDYGWPSISRSFLGAQEGLRPSLEDRARD